MVNRTWRQYQKDLGSGRPEDLADLCSSGTLLVGYCGVDGQRHQRPGRGVHKLDSGDALRLSERLWSSIST